MLNKAVEAPKAEPAPVAAPVQEAPKAEEKVAQEVVQQETIDDDKDAEDDFDVLIRMFQRKNK